MQAGGYYLMHRGWQDNPIFKAEPYTEREAWEWLIANAAYRDTKHRLGGAVVTVGRGQIAVTVRDLGEKWRWPKSRVARFINTLKNAEMIRAESGTGTARAKSVITICNYERFQVPWDMERDETGTRAGQARDKGGTLKNSGNTRNTIIREGGAFAPAPDETNDGVLCAEGDRSTPDRENMAKPSRGSRLPEDFTLPEAWRTWAVEAGLDPPAVRREAEKFRDHWHGETGVKARKADWFATWRNWVRRDLERGTRHGTRRTDTGKQTRHRNGFSELLYGTGHERDPVAAAGGPIIDHDRW